MWATLQIIINVVQLFLLGLFAEESNNFSTSYPDGEYVICRELPLAVRTSHVEGPTIGVRPKLFFGPDQIRHQQALNGSWIANGIILRLNDEGNLSGISSLNYSVILEDDILFYIIQSFPIDGIINLETVGISGKMEYVHPFWGHSKLEAEVRFTRCYTFVTPSIVFVFTKYRRAIEVSVWIKD